MKRGIGKMPNAFKRAFIMRLEIVSSALESHSNAFQSRLNAFIWVRLNAFSFIRKVTNVYVSDLLFISCAAAREPRLRDGLLSGCAGD